ncbi:MAG TPA: SusC/RagA family TonB-linked outer membrane protein [Sediminibacterium sp.]|nr:SusC/RagA family TonB-linked outer membrane protein [Sediminibacterium sp.]
MKKIVSTLTVALLCFTLAATAQVHPITGTVKDDQGAPIPNSSVRVKGTNTAAIADASGNYRISASENSVLVFSAIGFNTYEQKVGKAGVINISLSKAVNELENVVVTALGVKRRPKELGYAQSTIKADQITAGQSPTIGQALSGKVAGLTIMNQNSSVNQDVKVVLRGYRSIGGNNEALIVLDGVPVPQNTLAYINPQDVESVTVLKGGQAATLYGSDGVNGALMINTKKGNIRPVINFVHSTTIDQISFFPKVQTEYGSGSDYGGAPLSSDNFRPFENQQYGDAFDGKPRDVGRVLEDGSHLVVPYAFVPNQKKNAFNTGHTISNSLSLSAGDERTGRYFMSVQDLEVQGVVPGDEYHRDAFRFNASRTFGKIRTAFDGTFTSDRTQRTSADFYNLVFNTPGEIPLTDLRDWQHNKFASPNGYFNDYYDNPYFAADNNRRDIRDNFFNGNVSLDYKPTNWLSATYRLGTAITNVAQKNWTGQFLYSAYSKQAKTFDPQYNDYNGIYRARTDVLGAVTDYAQWASRISSDLLITAEKHFKNYSAKLILGNSVQVRQSKDVQVNSASIVIPGIYNVNNTAGVLTGSGTSSLQRKYSYFADGTIGYKDLLFLHGSLRNDNTSVFFKDTRPSNLYSFWYYGGDASIILTDIFSGLKSDVINYAKLRGGWNLNRNDNLSPYNLDPVYSPSSGFPYGTTVGLTASSNYPDGNIHPETITTTEVGLEMGLLKNRINLDLSYYVQRSKDLILSAGVSNSTGYSSYTLNAADLTNHGFEADLKASIIRSASVSWDVSANYTYNTNKVNKIFQGLPKFQSGSLGTSAYSFAELGLAFPYLEVSGFQRDAAGHVVVDPSTFWPIKDLNLRKIGNTLPKHIIGFSTQFSYKGFTLATTLEFRTGYYVMNGSGLTSAFTGAGAITDTYHRKPFVWPNSVVYDAASSKYITNTNKVDDYTAWYGGWGDVGSPTSAANIGEFYANSGQFLKVRDASLSYAIPQSLLKRTKFIKTATVTLIGRNLLMFLPKDNIYADPEFNAFATSSNNVGINTTANTPPTRSYGVTLNVGF